MKNIYPSKYIQEQLLPEEAVLYIAKMHLQIFRNSLMISAVLIFSWIMAVLYNPWTPQMREGIVFTVFLIPFIWIGPFIEYIRTEIVITNKRVIAEFGSGYFGFIFRNTFEMSLDKVKGVETIKFRPHSKSLVKTFIVLKGTYKDSPPIPYVAKYDLFKRILISASKELGRQVAAPTIF